MKIELFTEVNFRGPTAKNGKCIALVECETKKGPAVKAQIEEPIVFTDEAPIDEELIVDDSPTEPEDDLLR